MRRLVLLVGRLIRDRRGLHVGGAHDQLGGIGLRDKHRLRLLTVLKAAQRPARFGGTRGFGRHFGFLPFSSVEPTLGSAGPGD